MYLETFVILLMPLYTGIKIQIEHPFCVWKHLPPRHPQENKCLICSCLHLAPIVSFPSCLADSVLNECVLLHLNFISIIWNPSCALRES